MRWQETYKIGLAVALVGFLTTGCELTDEENQAIDRTLNPPVSGPPNLSYPPDGPFCYSEMQLQPDAEITKKIDVLFVVDTSGSLVEERDEIGDGVDALLGALPADVDAQFGVMLAHVGSRSGRLYRRYSDKPYVLNAANHSSEELRTILRDRMRLVATENETDGGEAGLYSLNEAFSEANLLESVGHGFFREDAALAVVFVADENDICARYPQGVVPVVDPNNKEIPAFNRYCANITPESVLAQVRAHQGERPSVVAGIIYHEQSDFPAVGENEIGYGYLEMIRMANGVAIDLAGNHIHQGLDQIGLLATKKLNLKTEFPLSRLDFDMSSLQVLVDGEPADHNYNADVNEVHLTGYAGVENSEIRISYCAKRVEEPGDPGNGDDGGSDNGDDGNVDDGDNGNGDGGGDVGEEPADAPVVISDFRILEITGNTASFAWETDKESTTQLQITNVDTGEVTYTLLDTNLVLSHVDMATGLRPNTLYDVQGMSERNGIMSLSEPLRLRTRRQADEF
ncbi:MAG: hypothetical protein H6626_05995 [Pseudobdellovibrionaceae bacterium]|nr:hypothetical protein [Bdellovibrionales bacterium]USN48642.1 MAG: hypothetical protein H6626_05995 [Pseudobdellovibrionaceae bacterium]